MPSQAKRGQGITCPGSILMTVKRKKEVKKGEVDMEWI
jgi:TusA-related sulfurtransferase